MNLSPAWPDQLFAREEPARILGHPAVLLAAGAPRHGSALTKSTGTIYATIASEFPEVSTWYTLTGDLVLLASVEPMHINIAALRARVAQEPYHSALAYAWRVTDAEGFIAHHIMSADMAKLLVEAEKRRSPRMEARADAVVRMRLL